MKIRTINILIFFTFLGLLSCTNKNCIFRATANVNEQAWNKDSAIKFVAEIADTTNFFDIYISVRNNNAYPAENLYLFIKTESPKGNFVVDTVNLKLADDYGKWLGKKVSRLWDNKFPYRKKVKFADLGKYVFEIQQGMRNDNLEGIRNISIDIDLAKDF